MILRYINLILILTLTFFLPHSFKHKFENVPLELHLQILYAESIDKGPIIRVKGCPLRPTS